MPNAYSNARVFVFPSEYEGFGLPVLEAMASGTPMVLCDASALPEVGGDAAFYFPPRNASALAEVVSVVLGNETLALEQAKKGLERARDFSWESSARRLADCYRATI